MTSHNAITRLHARQVGSSRSTLPADKAHLATGLTARAPVRIEIVTAAARARPDFEDLLAWNAGLFQNRTIERAQIEMRFSAVCIDASFCRITPAIHHWLHNVIADLITAAADRRPQGGLDVFCANAVIF